MSIEMLYKRYIYDLLIYARICLFCHIISYRPLAVAAPKWGYQRAERESWRHDSRLLHLSQPVRHLHCGGCQRQEGISRHHGELRVVILTFKR